MVGVNGPTEQKTELRPNSNKLSHHIYVEMNFLVNLTSKSDKKTTKKCITQTSQEELLNVTKRCGDNI